MDLTKASIQPERKIVWAFDPGKITGFAVGTFSDTEPLKINHVAALYYEEITLCIKTFTRLGLPTYVVSEEFKLRTNNEFAADESAKKVEGVLDTLLGPGIIYRSRTKKAQVPDRVLKENRLWQTGRTVNWEDGRDANDAIIHMLGFVAFDLRHLPTLRKYFKPNYGKVEL